MIEKYLPKVNQFVLAHRILLTILLVTFLVRLPSLFEPLWYGDEAIYLAIGQKIANGGMMYLDIFDHKTPGIYYLAAWTISFFGENVWSFRFLLMIWTIAATGAFYFLSKEMFGKKTGVAATLILSALLSTPLLEGNITNSEILMILPTSLAILFGLRKRFFLAGVLFSLSFLLKFTGIFDFGAFFVLILLSVEKTQIKKTVQNLLILGVGWLLPILLSAFYFAANGALSAYLDSAFLYNLSYTSYRNSFLVGNSLLVLKLLPVIGVFGYFAVRSFQSFRKQGKTNFGYFEFLIIWLVFTFYGATFGGRPYEHYIIQFIPALSLITAVSIFNKPLRKIGLAFASTAIILTLVVGFRPFVVPSYYTNFFSYLLKRTSFDHYAGTFNKQTPTNYAMATFLRGCEEYNSEGKCSLRRNRSRDELYVFADQPAIYFLSDLDPASKYVTFFHVKGSEKTKSDTIASIKRSEPKYILVEIPAPGDFSDLEKLLRSSYNLFALYENIAIYKLRIPSEI
jgi:4-amino-4-deoxy-L-arabinose transferase-like glycosyltransferase